MIVTCQSVREQVASGKWAVLIFQCGRVFCCGVIARVDLVIADNSVDIIYDCVGQTGTGDRGKWLSIFCLHGVSISRRPTNRTNFLLCGLCFTCVLSIYHNSILVHMCVCVCVCVCGR